MCGIVGILTKGGKPLPESSLVRRMATAISHRGPDGYGEYRDQFIHMASVRLAVLDLEHGSQPAFGEDNRTVAVYNGEIYNYQSLAHELQQDGKILGSTGDTVILPYLFQKYHSNMASKLRGMFAFAIWNIHEREFFLCRDRIGIKPMYFAETPDYFLFSSEIKGIIAAGLFKAEIDRSSLDDLFSLSYPFPPKTMFQGIEELLPAHWIMCQVGSSNYRSLTIHKRRYWRAPFLPKGEHKTVDPRSAADELFELLSTTVKDHLISDVKIGTYLSGGIDSSLITALTCRSLANSHIDSFTIGFPGNSLDESYLAKSLAATHNLRHHVIDCNNSVAELFLRSVYHTELPLQYPLASAFLALSKAVAQSGVKVILTGEGADELFAGYDCFRFERVRASLDFPGARHLKRFIYGKMLGWLGSPIGTAEFFLRAQARPSHEVVKEFGGVRPPWYDIWQALDYKRDELLAVDGRIPRPTTSAPDNFCQHLREDIALLTPLDAAISVELETRLPSWTVLIDDRTSMANGVETRVPFLDHRIVEWVCQQHPKFKLHFLEEKFLLRRAALRALPADLAKRKKRPFYSPIKESFFGQDSPEFVCDLLSDTALSATGLFVPHIVRDLQLELAQVSDNSFRKHQLEWILALVLGTQALHKLFTQPMKFDSKNFEEFVNGKAT